MVEFINLPTPRLSIADAEGRLRPDIACTRSPGVTICKKDFSQASCLRPDCPGHTNVLYPGAETQAPPQHDSPTSLGHKHVDSSKEEQMKCTNKF